MTYDPTIPIGTNNISADRPKIQTNFFQLDDQFGEDHVNFLTLGNNGSGYHKKVTYNGVQASTPASISAYPISGSYPKAFGTAPNIGQEQYFAERRQTNGLLEMYVPGVKAMCTVQQTAGVTFPTYSFITTNTLTINVNTGITPVGATPTITFTNALDYATYYVFIMQINPDASQNLIVSARNTTSVQLTPQSNTTSVWGIMVI